MTEKEEILELYKTYVVTITANEQRRQQLSAFYLSLVAAGVAALGAIKNLDPLYIVGPAFVISLIWYMSIKYFRALAKAKFKVVAEMENRFPVQPFALEWKFYKDDNKTEDAKERTVRPGLSHLDMAVPFVLLLASGGYLAIRFISIFL